MHGLNLVRRFACFRWTHDHLSCTCFNPGNISFFFFSASPSPQAMAYANDLVVNMTINFKYFGFAPTSENGCTSKALSVYCNGTSTCASALDSLCGASRPPEKAAYPTPVATCLECAAKQIGNPALDSCTDAQVAHFCSTGQNGSLVDQTVAACESCANALKTKIVTCHILHSPVMQLPVYNCDGCNPTDVNGYCSTSGSGKPSISHDECWQTRSANTKQWYVTVTSKYVWVVGL